MIKSESVADLLTHDKILPSRRVVRCAVKVCIVDFSYALGDVSAADPNMSYSKPAVIAIFAVANFYASASCAAIFGIGLACDNISVKNG